MKEHVASLRRNHSGVYFGCVLQEEKPELHKKANIESLPTYHLYLGQKQVTHALCCYFNQYLKVMLPYPVTPMMLLQVDTYQGSDATALEDVIQRHTAGAAC
jgi:hypothetical protein